MDKNKIKQEITGVYRPQEGKEVSEEYPYFLYNEPLTGDQQPAGAVYKVGKSEDTTPIVHCHLQDELVLLEAGEWSDSLATVCELDAKGMLSISQDSIECLYTPVAELEHAEQVAILKQAFEHSSERDANTAIARMMGADASLDHLYSGQSS